MGTLDLLCQIWCVLGGRDCSVSSRLHRISKYYYCYYHYILTTTNTTTTTTPTTSTTILLLLLLPLLLLPLLLTTSTTTTTLYRGEVTIRGEVVHHTRDLLVATFAGNKLSNKEGFFSTSDPFLVISRLVVVMYYVLFLSI